jgi:hypothetical protein
LKEIQEKLSNSLYQNILSTKEMSQLAKVLCDPKQIKKTYFQTDFLLEEIEKDKNIKNNKEIKNEENEIKKEEKNDEHTEIEEKSDDEDEFNIKKDNEDFNEESLKKDENNK